MKPYLRLIFLWLLLLPAGLQAELSVEARFNPPRIALGDRAQYIVEIRETDDRSQPQPAAIDSLPVSAPVGLELLNPRTSNSQQTRIINGVAEYTAIQSIVVEARPGDTGSYTIPSYELRYKGRALSVPAATLQVVERAADAAPPLEDLIFLRADLPAQLYVGQAQDFALELYLAEQVRQPNLHRFDRTADGFVLSELPERSEQRFEILDGRRYRVLSWPMVLTPIQTGEQPLRFEFNLSARLPGSDAGARHPFGRSPFGSSLFDDFFGRTERFNVFNGEQSIEVLPLPEAGRPDSFRGAVGDFAMEVGSDAEAARQGEPVMLSVQLRGRGNFDRIDGPVYEDSATWRSYEPEASFEPSDALGLRGSKRFDYVFIPRKSGSLALPATEFTYFDPAEARYITLTAPELPIEVAPAAQSAPPPASSGGAAPAAGIAPDLPLTRSLSTEEALLTLDYQPQAPRPLGLGLLRHPLFVGANVLLGLALIAGCLWLSRQRKLRADPQWRLRRAARAASLAAAQAAGQARREGASETFYQQAQVAVREALTARTGQRFAAAGRTEIRDGMERLGTDPGIVAATDELFATADAHRFGRSSQASLDAAADHLDRILKAL